MINNEHVMKHSDGASKKRNDGGEMILEGCMHSFERKRKEKIDQGTRNAELHLV